jgi:hypothetical protein
MRRSALLGCWVIPGTCAGTLVARSALRADDYLFHDNAAFKPPPIKSQADRRQAAFRLTGNRG